MEYIISQTGSDTYEVAKFDSLEGGEQPLAVYDVRYNPSRGIGKCNCWPGMRGAAMNDKHVKLVVKWLAEGRPLTILADSAHQAKKAKLKTGS